MLADMIGRWEFAAILVVIFVLFGAPRLPKISRGMRKGFAEFVKAFEHASQDAGKSIGGILWKPAAQALTPDNQTAELYDPAVFHRGGRAGRSFRRGRVRRWRRLWRLMWRSVVKRLTAIQTK